jgi:hypothetical protein
VWCARRSPSGEDRVTEDAQGKCRHRIDPAFAALAVKQVEDIKNYKQTPAERAPSLIALQIEKQKSIHLL